MSVASDLQVRFARFAPTPHRCAQLARWLRPPSARTEIAVWLFIAALMIGLRLYVAWRLPAYIWTRDSGSYVDPATDWLETGRWVTNPRRGPIYSLFIAYFLQHGGSLLTVANAQAIIGAFTAFLTVAAARVWLGRLAFWPLALCAFFYAIFPLSIELERLLRNETLLTLFCTVAFGAWRFVLRENVSAPQRAGWMALCGLSAGLMQLLKGIFPVFPVMVLGVLAWHWRRRPALAALLAACFLAPYIAPMAASKLYDRRSGTGRPPEPEDGIMFYGRTAQWTVLDGGIEPAIKALIRDQVEAYAERFRRTGRLENNEIVKRTVVPSLKRIMVERDGGAYRATELNRFCWRLGLEAVRHHPWAYLRQWIKDVQRLNFVIGHDYEPFKDRVSLDAARDMQLYYAAHFSSADTAARPNAAAVGTKAFRLKETTAALTAVGKRQSMKWYSRLSEAEKYLRMVSPAFLTTLLLPLLWRATRGGERHFWLTAAALWYSYLFILSTVGRPLDRYLMPVLPLIFWTVAAALALGWQRYGYPYLQAAERDASNGANALGNPPLAGSAS